MTSFDHLALTVTDIRASKEFYRKAFGFESVVDRRFDSVGQTACFIQIPGDSAQLQLNIYDVPKASHPEDSHYSIRTDDIDALRARHEELGFKPTAMVDVPHQRCYFVIDPDGYQIEVIQPKK